MTPPAPEPARRAWVPGLRRACALAGLVLWVLVMVPPVAAVARRYEFVQSVQFAVLGFWAPALLTVGAPWRAGRVAPDGAGTGVVARVLRRRRANSYRAVTSAIAFIVVSILWRVVPAVDALTAHPWLVVLEGVSLTALGAVLMSDLVESPPLHPGIARPFRIGVATAVMWSAWVFAYLEAMSTTSWYRAFQHVSHRALSISADQQLSAASVWFMTAVVFVPIIFWNLVLWLQAEEDPDEELHKLVREERQRGFFGYRG